MCEARSEAAAAAAEPPVDVHQEDVPTPQGCFSSQQQLQQQAAGLVCLAESKAQ
jgi:hypothetical protein